MTTLKNSVQLIGRLGNDPQIMTFENGNKKASFSIATNDVYYNNKGERVEETHWHNVIVYGKKVETIESFLHKGSEIALQGKLITRSYEKEGITRYITEVNLNEMYMLDKKKDK